MVERFFRLLGIRDFHIFRPYSEKDELMVKSAIAIGESAGEAASMPEISDSSPIPAPEVSAAPASDVTAVAVSTPEVSRPSTPSTPYLDITV